jgi:hypothetical protein
MDEGSIAMQKYVALLVMSCVWAAAVWIISDSPRKKGAIIVPAHMREGFSMAKVSFSDLIFSNFGGCDLPRYRPAMIIGLNGRTVHFVGVVNSPNVHDLERTIAEEAKGGYIDWRKLNSWGRLHPLLLTNRYDPTEENY